MDRRRAAGTLLALAACIACSAAAPTANNHTALDLYEAQPEGCFYNFQHYGEGDRIMTNEPCLNCTCHNRMLMCYLRVCPFTKPIGQDCTVEKRADQCCPIVTCPDVPVDLLTSTSTSSPAEYGATGIGKLDRYGCSINGKYFSEGSKVPPTPNKPCEHCYCIRNMTTCVMQECTLHVDGCTPIYHKDVCCPVRYSCDHPEDEIPLLDDMTTTVRPTPGFLLTTTTMAAVTQVTQDCVHDDKIFADGALIKTEKACEHCYCMKGDIVCVVQECGTPMENEGKNCTSLPPREGQCCPDTYICEGDELTTELTEEFTTETMVEKTTTLSPPRRVGVEGSGYRNEPDDVSYTQMPFTEPEIEGSGDEYIKEEKPQDINEIQSPVLPEEKLTTINAIPQLISTTVPATESYEKESTEENASEHSHLYIPSTNASPELYEKTTLQPTNIETTTPHEFYSSESDKIAPSTTDIAKSEVPESETIKSEGQDLVTERSTEEESDVPHKNIITTTGTSNIEGIESSTTTMGSQVYTTEGISEEEVYEPHKYSTSIIDGPASEDDSVTTDSYKESDLVSTEKSEQDSSKPNKYVPSVTSTPFLEEVEKASTETFDEHNVGTVSQESSEPQVDLITTSVPTLDENVKVTKPDKDKNTASNTDTDKDSMEPHKHETIATINPFIEEIAKTTTVAYEEASAITEISDNESYQSHKHIESTTSASVLDESERATMKPDLDTSIHYGTTELTESDVDVMKASTSIPNVEEIVIATAKPDQHITDESTEKESYKPEEYITTTLKSPNLDINDTDSIGINKKDYELSGGTTQEAVFESTTITPALESIKTTTQVDDENVITHDIPEKVDMVSHEHVPITTSITLIDDSEKATIEPGSDADEFTTEKYYEQQKPDTTNSPIVEENEIVTTDMYREDEHISSEITDQEISKPTEYGSSTSSTPFLEEVEKATMDSHESHVSDQVTETASYKPHRDETSTPVVGEIPSEPDKGVNTIPSGISEEDSSESSITEKTELLEETDDTEPIEHTQAIDDKHTYGIDEITTGVPSYSTSPPDSIVTKEDQYTVTAEPTFIKEDDQSIKTESQNNLETTTTIIDHTDGATFTFIHAESTEASIQLDKESKPTVSSESEYTHEIDKFNQEATTELFEPSKHLETIKPEKDTSTGIDAGDVYTTPTIEKIDLPETTTINLGENEIHEDTILSHGRIPGEGDCLLNGITYINESTVPNTNKCTSGCRCVSSIIKCDPIICSPPPEYMDNCQAVYDSPESCCPTYICDQLRETLPPLPHIKVTTPETPETTSAIECHGNQCEPSEDKRQPTIPSDEKGETTQCTSQDCIKDIQESVHTISSSEHPELCDDGKCTPREESCANGECQYPPIHGLPVVPCEGDSCITTPESQQHVLQPCENDETCKVVKIPEISSTPCEGDTCTNIKQDCVAGDCSTTIVSPPETSQHKVSCDGDDGCKDSQDNIKECADGSCRRKETTDSEVTPSKCSGLDCKEATTGPTQHIEEPQQNIVTSEHEQTTKSSLIDVSQHIITESPESHELERHTETESPELHTISTTEKIEGTGVPELEKVITIIPEKAPDHVLLPNENDVTKETEVSPTESDKKLPESVTSSYTPSEGATVEEITDIPSLDIQKDNMLTTMESEMFVTESTKIQTKEPDVHVAESNTETMPTHDESHTESQTYVPDIQESVTKTTNELNIQTVQPIDFVVEEKESSLVTEAPSVSTVVPGEEIISDQQEFVTKVPEPGDNEAPESYITQPQHEVLVTDDKVTESPDTKLEKDTKQPEDVISEQESTTKTAQEIITESMFTEYEVTTAKPLDSLITSTKPAEKVTELDENIIDTSKQPEHVPKLEEHTETKITNEQELTTKAYIPEITISQQENTVTHIEESQDTTELPLYQITESQELLTNVEEDVSTEQKPIAPMTSSTEEVIEFTTPSLSFESEHEKITSELPESHVTEIVTLGAEATTTEKEILSTKDEHEPHFTKPQETVQNETQEEITPTYSTLDVKVYSSTEPGISEYDKSKIESTDSPQTEIDSQTSKQVDDESRTALPELLTTGLPDKITESLYNSEKEYTHTETTLSYETITKLPEEQISEHEIKMEPSDVLSPEKEKLSTELPFTVNEPEELVTIADDIHTSEQENPITEKIATSISEEETDTEIPVKVTEKIELNTVDSQEADVETLTEDSRKPTETSTILSVDLSTNSQVYSTEKTMPSEEELYIPVKQESSSELTHTDESTEAELPEKATVGEEHEIITDTPDLAITTNVDISEHISTQSQEIDDKTPEHAVPQLTQTELPIITTKAPEVITTQQFDRVTETSELATHETITEKATVIDEDIYTEPNIITEPQEILNGLAGDVTDTDSHTEQNLSALGPQEHEITTHISDLHSTIHEDEKFPELLVPLVTKPQETSTKATDVQVTETIKLITELLETSTEKQIEMKDSEPTPTTDEVLQTDNQSVTDIHKESTELPTTLSVHTELPDLRETTVESQDTVHDQEDVTESVIPIIVSSNTTEISHGITQTPESMITGLEEVYTSSPLASVPDYKETQTTPTKLIEPVETSTKILEREITEPEEKITGAPNILTPEKQETPSILPEAHTVPQETVTETQIITEISTELLMQPISETAQDITQLPAQSGQTSVPQYEHSETTPYLVELEEHTHKILDETTISPVENEKTPTYTELDETKDVNQTPEITTEKHAIDQSEFKKETTQVQEQTPIEDQTTVSKDEPEKSTHLPTTALEEEPEKSTHLLTTVAEEVPEKSTHLPTTMSEQMPEKSTHLPTTVLEEIPEKSTDLPIAVSEAVPEKSTDLPIAVSEEIPEKSTDLPIAVPEEVPEKSTDLPIAVSEEIPEKSTDLPIAVPEEGPEKSTDLPIAVSEEIPEKSTDLPIAVPEEVPEKSTDLPIAVSEEAPEKSTDLPFAVSEEVPEKSTHSIIEDTFSVSTEPQQNKEHISIDLEKEMTTSVPTKHTELEKVPSSDSDITGQTEKDTSLPETPLQTNIPIEMTTAIGEEVMLATTKVSTVIPDEVSTQSSVPDNKIIHPEEKPSELPSIAPELPKPVVSETQPSVDVPSPEEDTHFPPSGSSGYGGEDYGEEDQAFGPGTCRYGGKVYVSAQQIPRDDPCDFCFCFRSDIICLQQSCPPPIHGCHEEPIQGFCCPRYECPVSMATTLNVTTTTTTTTTTLPPHFPTHPYKGAAQRRGCQIKGHTYKVGEVVRASSGPCLHCTCGGDGQMKCDPKACTPEPMLRQMIAAAVSAKRRR